MAPQSTAQRAAVCLLTAILVHRACAAVLDQSDWTLQAGFAVSEYFTGAVPKARSLAVSGDSKATGPVITYCSSQSFSYETDIMDVYALVDLKGRGAADYMMKVIPNLSPMPNGIAWFKGSLFVASLNPYKSCTLFRLDNVDSYALKKQAAKKSDLKVVLDNLPIDFWHGWKFIRFSPDGKLYVPIGANCNQCRLDGTPPNNGYVDGKLIYTVENSLNTSHVTAPYQKDSKSPVFQFGSIYRMDPTGQNIELFATGVRNTVGFDFHPDTGHLYFTDNGRDDIGGADSNITDNQPDCELNYAPTKGLFFGFPYCHTGPAGGNPDFQPYLRDLGIGPNIPDPDVNAGQKAMKCNGGRLPFTPAIQAQGPHVAPLGMRFYRWNGRDIAQFPKKYDRNIFIAQHGSWNRAVAGTIGARVMRVILSPSNPSKVVAFEPFLSGGVIGDKGDPGGPNPPPRTSSLYNGRPVDVEQLPDGSLLVSDDYADRIYRITYVGASGCHVPSSIPPNDDDATGCGYGSEGPFVNGAAVQGADLGCAVNMGSGGVTRYRRCLRFDMTGRRDFLYFSYSLQIINGKLVLLGSLLAMDWDNFNENGWMAFGVAPPGEDGMVGSNAIVVQPSGPDSAVAVDYFLGCEAFRCFKETKNFLLKGATAMRAARVGGALVSTFAIFANRPAGSAMNILFALGDRSKTGTILQHWTTSQTTITLASRDIGAAVSRSVPVLNTRGLPSPDPQPSPSPAPLDCTLDGVAYDGCADVVTGAVMMKHYYKLAGSTLQVALRADTTPVSTNPAGWAAWAYSATARMENADALFVMPCIAKDGACPSGAKAQPYNMPTRLPSQFSTTTKVAKFSDITASKLPSGELLVRFSVSYVRAGAGMQILYGAGGYTSTGVLQKHPVTPRPACITPTAALKDGRC